jgi:hypothetical protein
MGVPMRRACFTAVILASVLMVGGTLTGAVQADVSVGHVQVEQMAANGQVITSENFAVSSEVRQIQVAVVQGAVFATITNGSDSRLTVSTDVPETPDPSDRTLPVTIEAGGTLDDYRIEGKTRLFLDFSTT